MEFKFFYTCFVIFLNVLVLISAYSAFYLNHATLLRVNRNKQCFDSEICHFNTSSLSRYLSVGDFFCDSGLGHCSLYLERFYNLSIMYNLELVFTGNFTVVGHKLCYVNEGMGLKSSPALIKSLGKLEYVAIDPVDEAAQVEVLDKYLDITNIVFGYRLEWKSPGVAEWSRTVLAKHNLRRPSSCMTARSILIHNFWKYPRNCTFLNNRTQNSDLWLIVIHIRRGDTIGDLFRQLPNEYFVRTSRVVVASIVKLFPSANISVIVLTEDTFLQDTNRQNVESRLSDFCLGAGLVNCSVFLGANWETMNTVNCMAASDILITSRSGFSHFGGILTRGVVVAAKMWHMYPDRRTLIVPMNESVIPTLPGFIDLQLQHKLEKLLNQHAECRENYL